MKEYAITPYPLFQFVTVKDGLFVKYDGHSIIEVKILSTMLGQLCGICSDADGNGTNDWIIGPSALCMDKYPEAVPGQQTTYVNIFGSSWTAAVDWGDSLCTTDCPTPPPRPGCDIVSHEQAKEHCKITHDMNGPFAECLVKMPEDRREEAFDNCLFDTCVLMVSDTIVCTFSTTLAATCEQEYKTLVNWRTEDFCRKLYSPIDKPHNLITNRLGLQPVSAIWAW